MKRVLLIEDDRDIVELVRYNLEREGFQVAAASDGATGLAQIRKTPPDILLLDLMLPKLSGLDICKEIRRDQSLNRLPILMLTARGEEADRVVGLEMGADDYVTKPFSPRELGARVKALLRRTEPAGEATRVIESRGLTIDPSSYRVTHDGQPVTLSTLEFRLLYYLATRPNRVFYPRPVAGRRLGHRAIRDAAQRGCLHPPAARKSGNRRGPSFLLENGSRRRLHV